MRVLRDLASPDSIVDSGSVQQQISSVRRLSQQAQIYDTQGPGFTYLFSKTLGSITQTMTRLVTIKAKATKVMRKTLPLLAGNLPRMIQYY